MEWEIRGSVERARLLFIGGWGQTQRSGVRDGKLPGDDADLCGIAELVEELFAVFPGEAKCAHVGDANPRYNVTNGRKIGWIEFAVHHCRFCPGYQAVQRQFMVQMRESFSATVSRVMTVMFAIPAGSKG